MLLQLRLIDLISPFACRLLLQTYTMQQKNAKTTREQGVVGKST